MFLLFTALFIGLCTVSGSLFILLGFESRFNVIAKILTIQEHRSSSVEKNIFELENRINHVNRRVSSLLAREKRRDKTRAVTYATQAEDSRHISEQW